FMLTHQSLWFDEGWSLSYSDASSLLESISKVRELGGEAGDSNRFCPLYPIVLFCWREVFGDTEFALRSLSVFLWIFSVIALFFNVLRIYGKKQAIWSSLILALSSFCVYHSQEVRNYSLLIFLTSLQLFFFTEALYTEESKKTKYFKFGFWLFTAIGLFGNILMVIFSTSLAISYLITYRNLKQWLTWWIPAVLFCVPVFIYYFTLPDATNPTSIPVSRQGFPIIQNALFVIYGLLVGTSYGPPMEQLRGQDRVQVVLNYWPHLLILSIVISIILVALFRVLFISRDSLKYKKLNRFFSLLLVLLFFLSLFFAIATKINFVPRHAFYACLPLAIILPSAFIDRQNSKSTKTSRFSQLGKFAVILLLILNVYSNFQYYFNQNYARDDYRAAAQYIQENKGDSVQSILLWGHLRLLRYYGDTLTLDGTKSELENIKGKNLAQQVNSLSQNAKTVFLVLNREFYWGRKRDAEEEMSSLYALKSQVGFPYFNIYRFTKMANRGDS
ncbi:MAG: glycosyltransferase family 39 protein, partial [Spirulinaceae cyanobacterium]